MVKLNLIAFSLLYLLLSNLTNSSAQDKKTGLEDIVLIVVGEDTRGRNRLPDIPLYSGNIGMYATFSKYAKANLTTLLNGPRPREGGDTRRDIPPQAVVNLIAFLNV